MHGALKEQMYDDHFSEKEKKIKVIKICQCSQQCSCLALQTVSIKDFVMKPKCKDKSL